MSGYLLPVFTPPTEWLRLGSLVLDWFSVGGALCLLNPVYMVVNRYSIVQYSTAQYSTVQGSTVQLCLLKARLNSGQQIRQDSGINKLKMEIDIYYLR